MTEQIRNLAAKVAAIVVMLVDFFLAVSLSLGAPAGSFGHWKGESWRAHEEASKALKTLRYLKVRQ